MLINSMKQVSNEIAVHSVGFLVILCIPQTVVYIRQIDVSFLYGVISIVPCGHTNQQSDLIKGFEEA